MRTWIVSGVISASALSSAMAIAQPAPVETAESLFARAQEHMKNGAFRAACPLFAESLRVDPQVGTLLNLAGCEEKIGALTQALAHWREAIDKLSGPGGDPKYLAFAKKRADDLDARVPRLTIRLAPGFPAGSRVLRGGEELASAALGVPMPLNPGEVEVVAIAPRRQDRRESVTLVEGDRKEITLEPGPEIAPLPAPPAAAPALTTVLAPALQPLPEPSFGKRHKVSLILAGVGAGVAVAGIACGVATKNEFFDIAEVCKGGCNPDFSSLQRKWAATNVLLGVAGAAGVASVVTFVVEARRQSPSVALTVDGLGARAAVRF